MKIIVNGEPHEYAHKKIGYDEVVKLATGKNSQELTVTYFWRSHLHDLTRNGSLSPGVWKPRSLGNLRKTIEVAEGMEFTAVWTGAA
jgi:hypothetical protein